MSKQVLARQWRPQNFAQMVGQQHVVRALQNALQQQRLHHAYLFTGTRGVGKTTLARILAKCLSCETGITPTPCGTCATCREIETGRFIDLLEVDAASRTKVEDTRDLLDNVQYAPSHGRFKLYIIDEVHMLSGHSFNALLKTLEEPPPHVKFLLATTDPQKLPVTVLSRCLQFHLKNMPVSEISQHLAKVLDEEQVSFETSALTLLAHAANGSMRDGLSLLEQAIAYGENQVVTDAVQAMLGTVLHTQVFPLLTALINHDAAALYAAIHSLSERITDYSALLETLLLVLHHIALTQALPQDISNTLENAEQLQQFATALNREQVQLWYQIGLHGRRDLPLAPTPQSGFEMTLLRMLAFHPTRSTPPAISNLTPQSSQQTVPSDATSQSAACHAPTEAIQDLGCRATTELPNRDNWEQWLAQLPLSGVSKTLVHHCTFSKAEDDVLELYLDEQQAPLLTPRNQQRINEVVSQRVQRPIKVRIQVGYTESASPAAKTQQQAKIHQQQAELALANDPNIHYMKERFDATLVPDSISVRPKP